MIPSILILLLIFILQKWFKYMQITFNEILINNYSSQVVRVLGSPFLGQSIPIVEINNPF